VPSEAMLVWYSDGLIERRGEVVDRGLDRLAALAAGLSGTDAQQWCESLLTGMTDGQLSTHREPGQVGGVGRPTAFRVRTARPSRPYQRSSPAEAEGWQLSRRTGK